MSTSKLDTGTKSVKLSCPHGSHGNCRDCNNLIMSNTGLDKSVDRINACHELYLQDNSIEALKQLKRSAVDALEYAERLIFMSELRLSETKTR